MVKQKVAAVVPAKGSSERIKSKNLVLVGGEPLVARAIRRLNQISAIDEVWLDTESDEIITACGHLAPRVLRRSPSLASNATDGHELFYNEAKSIECDILVQYLCTSPFIRRETFEAFAATLATRDDIDSVAAVRNERFYHWQNSRPAYELADGRIPNSVTLNPDMFETMGLYAMRRDQALQLKRRIGSKPLGYAVSPLEAVDVNTPEDLQLADLIAAGELEEERRIFSVMRNILSSAMLSDVCDELGVNAVIFPGLAANFDSAKCCGRIKTLAIRQLHDGEDMDRLYTSYSVYSFVNPSDVVFIANECEGLAFFGELNANLAVRRGASGAVVLGTTRDSGATARLGFPVFSQSVFCRDVRGRGTVESMNRPLPTSRGPVNPGDVCFADREGVVVIPAADFERTFQAATGKLVAETELIRAISHGTREASLLEAYGKF